MTHKNVEIPIMLLNNKFIILWVISRIILYMLI